MESPLSFAAPPPHAVRPARRVLPQRAPPQRSEAALAVAGKLTFELDGVDETQGTMTATQQHMTRLFSPELPSTLFHSQQSVLKLLEATDSEFKEALGSLVDMSLWRGCEEAAREREKAALARANACAGSRRTLAAAAAASEKTHTALQVWLACRLGCMISRGSLRLARTTAGGATHTADAACRRPWRSQRQSCGQWSRRRRAAMRARWTRTAVLRAC